MADSTIFRKKSMDRMASPEQLNDYLRVCSPGVWMVLAAVILLLAGVCVWGVFGRLNTTLAAAAVAENESLTVYIPADDYAEVEGKTVTVDGVEYEIADGAASDTPLAVSEEEFSEYTLHVGNLSAGEWVYGITFDTDLADGVYEADIVIESVSPMSFVLN
ncbi:MAG: hypothetical protein LIO96_13385 [Lachnospiraceae bacterium]|nr:hypothetical protein [Lachnospiraceae bacterium]